jgi:hypothetical protein
VIYELERIWKEAVMAYFMVISWHFPGGNDENHENLSQDLPNTKQEC